MFKEGNFDTGNVTINYAEGPQSGPPLVMIHGGGDRWQYFTPLLPTLAIRWQVFALDLRGHGASGRVTGQYRPEHYTADVTTFIEKIVDTPAALFGHSLGGWIALMAAAQLKERISALILGDPPLNLDRFLEVESTAERIGMWRWMRDITSAGMSVWELAATLAEAQGIDTASCLDAAAMLSQVDPDVALYHAEGRLGEYIENVCVEPSLKKLSCPVLLLSGNPEHGGVFIDGDVEMVLASLENGIHARLDGTGHDLGLSDWEVTPMLRNITNFLEAI